MTTCTTCALLIPTATAAQETLELPTLTVEGTANAGFFGESIAQSSGTVMKTDMPILETPRSVSIITQQDINDRGAQSIEQALRYAPGVVAGQYGIDARGDWTLVRGFAPSVQRDGLQSQFADYSESKTELFLLDSVSVLKGPAGVLYGAGSVGGILNTSSKLPDPYAPNIVQLEFGSYSFFQSAIDYNSQIGPDGKLLYRLVAMARDAQAQVDHSKDDARAFAPSITWNPTPQTSLSLLYAYQKTDASPLSQIFSPWGTLYPAPNGRFLDPTTFVGEPDFNSYDASNNALTGFFSHAFDAGWRIDATLRYGTSETDYRHAWWAYDNFDNFRYNADGTINRDVYRAVTETRSFLGDIHASTTFDLGRTRNEAMVGLGFTDARYDYDDGYNGPNGELLQNGPIDPFDPVYTGVQPVTITDNPASKLRQFGLYAQNRTTIAERLFVDIGLRYDDIETIAPTYVGQETSSNQDGEISTSAAILYASDLSFSPYASYSEVFQQEALGADSTGKAFEPTRGTQYELGVKYQPPGSSSLLSAAIFDITKSNLLVTDPENPELQVQIGEAHSRGLELGAQMAIHDFRLDAGYTYLDTEDPDGHALERVPNHLASLWLGYRPTGRLAGWKAGAGVRYVGASWDGTDTLETPDFTLYDAMLGYETGRYDISLNARNLADTTYVVSCGTIVCGYGETRTVTLTLTAKF